MSSPTLLLTHTVPPAISEDLCASLGETLADLDPALRSTDTPAATAEAIAGADAVVAGRFDADALAVAERLRWVHALSAGVDSYPTAELAAAGVALTNSSGVHAEPIGEQVLGYMLTFERRLHESVAQQRAGTWERVEGGELRGKTVGIVGVGAIGTRVAELADAVGMTVLGCKRDPATMPDVVDEAFPADAYRELCRRCDYLVLACPLTDETEGLLGMDEFRLMGAESVLVNVARGEVVDQDDLVRALQYGVIGGAALDVFEEEPLPSDSPLWNLSDVVITPHMAGSTSAKVERWTEIVAENYRRLAAADGDGDLDLRNPVV